MQTVCRVDSGLAELAAGAQLMFRARRRTACAARHRWRSAGGLGRRRSASGDTSMAPPTLPHAAAAPLARRLPHILKTTLDVRGCSWAGCGRSVARLARAVAIAMRVRACSWLSQGLGDVAGTSSC